MSTVVFDDPSGSMLKALFAASTTRRIWPLVEAGAVLGAARLQPGCRAALPLVKTVRENGQETTAVPALAVHQPPNRESQDHQIQECRGE